MQICFHEMLAKEDKQETARPQGTLVKLICLVTMKFVGPVFSQKLYSAVKLCEVNFKC